MGYAMIDEEITAILAESGRGKKVAEKFPAYMNKSPRRKYTRAERKARKAKRKRVKKSRRRNK